MRITITQNARIGRNLNDVEVFIKVVDSRSFSGAARQLGVPGSTVSRRVARLEAALGVRLLQRTTRKLSLTEAGALYYERSARALAELEHAENRLAESQRAPRGRVKVLVPVEHAISGRLVSEFLVRYPDIRVDMEFSSRNANIIEEGYDAAIHVGAVTNLSVVAYKLMDSPFRVVASPAYLEHRGEPTSVGSLTDHDCIIFGASSARASWELDGQRIPVRGRLAVNHMQAIRDAALAGLGLALLPLVVCRNDIDAGALRVTLDAARTQSVPIFVTYASGRFLPPAVRAFVDYVRERFEPVAARR